MTFYLRFGMCWAVSGKWERSCSIGSFFSIRNIVVLCSWCWHTYATTPGPSGVSWQVRVPGTVAEMFGDVEGREIRSGSRCRSRGPLGNFQCKVDDFCRPWGSYGWVSCVWAGNRRIYQRGKMVFSCVDDQTFNLLWVALVKEVERHQERRTQTPLVMMTGYIISPTLSAFFWFNRSTVQPCSTHRFLLVVNIK